MTSLVPDSLEFIAREVTAYQANPDCAVRNIQSRALLFRSQARFGQSNENLEEPDVIRTEIQKAPSVAADDREFSSKNVECSNRTYEGCGLPPIPVLKGVDPDALKNLLMSWFYAGYYTAKAECVDVVE